MADGDWLEIGQIGLKPAAGAKEATLALKQEWGKKPEPLRYAPGAAGGPLSGLPCRTGRGSGRPASSPGKRPSPKGIGVMVGEWGAFNKTPHDVVLRWAEDCLRNWQQAGWGWALWNFRGSFGVLDSDRATCTTRTSRATSSTASSWTCSSGTEDRLIGSHGFPSCSQAPAWEHRSRSSASLRARLPHERSGASGQCVPKLELRNEEHISWFPSSSLGTTAPRSSASPAVSAKRSFG